MQWALLVAAATLTLFALLPFVRWERWWIRMFDFPRLQVAVMAAVVLVAALLVGEPGPLRWSAVILALVALFAQLSMILPYTPLWPKESVDAIGGLPTLKVVIANVLMDNRDADGLIEFIRRERPDVVVLDEADEWWQQRLRCLHDLYPHRLEDPRDNTYGMLVYAATPMEDAQHRTILDPGIPSFHLCVRVDGSRVTLHLIHPAPPYPKFAKSTVGRDAELIVVGRLARREAGPVIVAGDLNDVAWSHTTRLFQRVSRLLDPRRGRGMYNTFHAKHWFARWPLDHLFHSAHFRLVRIERGPAYGSDHFPILIELELDPDARDEQSPPDLDQDARDEAQEKVAQAAAEHD